MMLNRLENQNLLKPISKNQNLVFKDIVNQINENLGKKQDSDTLVLTQKAKDLLKEKATEKEPILNYENSEQVGMFTKAQWAESSLLIQRDGMKSLEEALEYGKGRLEFTMGKITELENYINGTGTHSDPGVTKREAAAYLRNYKESIIKDYSDLVNKSIGVERRWANHDDEQSGGLASKVIENQLNNITAKTLGLTELSDNPEEIMKALDNALNKVAEMTTNIENAYANASGGKSFKRDAQYMVSLGNSYLSLASQLEKPEKLSVKDFTLTGKALELGDELVLKTPNYVKR